MIADSERSDRTRVRAPVREPSRVFHATLAAGLLGLLPGRALAQDEQQAAEGASSEQAAVSPGEQARAQDEYVRLRALGLSPEAPPTPSTPGGRAPAFGSDSGPGEWTFNLRGSISGSITLGLGRDPVPPQPNQLETPIHVPSRGALFNENNAGLSLTTDYGNQLVRALVTFSTKASGKEWEGSYRPTSGPNFTDAYLLVTPQPMGAVQLTARVGAFTAPYGSPEQWGWGLLGPLMAVRGYGETIRANYDASPELSFELEHGISTVPGLPEEFVRGLDSAWNEVGTSVIMHHAHAGLNYLSKYVLRLHYASAFGTDERQYVNVFPAPHDGRLDVYIAETHWFADPYGALGLSGALWNFDDAVSVHDGIWWGPKFTFGAVDMTRDYLGLNSGGNGKLAAVSTQYDLSLARVLWYPAGYDGRSPDLRLSLAGLYHWTLDTEDPVFEGAEGFIAQSRIEYRALPWMSAVLGAHIESRDWVVGRWVAASVSPGVEFRTDWQSPERIFLTYSRNFFNDRSDPNAARPLDLNTFSFGATLGF
jgi:hypothetical protein